MPQSAVAASVGKQRAEDGLCQAELLSHLLECIGLFFAGALCEQCHEFLILAYQGNLGVKSDCSPWPSVNDSGARSAPFSQTMPCPLQDYLNSF